jgi:hypothetical protein
VGTWSKGSWRNRKLAGLKDSIHKLSVMEKCWSNREIAALITVGVIKIVERLEKSDKMRGYYG